MKYLHVSVFHNAYMYYLELAHCNSKTDIIKHIHGKTNIAFNNLSNYRMYYLTMARRAETCCNNITAIRYIHIHM
jgi:hypothetical protein